MFTTHFKMTTQPFLENTPAQHILKDERITEGLARLQYLTTHGTLALAADSLSGGPVPLSLRFPEPTHADELRVTVLDDGVSREIRKRPWTGALALPNFFQSASRDRDTFEWRVEDPDRGIRVSVTYEMRAGRSILDVTHQSPPDSVRN